MKRSLLSVMILGIACAGFASPISPENALSRALKDFPHHAPGAQSPFKLIKTEQFNGKDAVYIFARTEGEGFMVTPADDKAPALLGYGDTGVYDEKGEMAPGFVYWISELGRQIEYASSKSFDSNFLRITRPERESIPVLCSTRWNQSAPYNNNCPEVGSQTCVTGCVATAMAQVMKFHNWPENGEGIVSYTGPRGKVLKMNFGRTTFKWADMLDTYDSSSSPEACEAVATLMQATGYSVEMNYSPSGSGALSVDIAPALGQYFKYDKSLRYLLRDYYSLVEWEDIIYNSLKNYGPVIYDGQAGIGGHSFVCDGYSSDGYFHFNWGWGGLSDGYFLLDALDPAHQGIGGADGGFDFMQDVIVDIRPDTTGDSAWAFQMYGRDYPDYTIESDEEGEYLMLNTAFYNYGPGSLIDAYVGFIFRNIDNPQADPVYELYSVSAISPQYGFSAFGADILSLEDGRYEVELICGVDENDPKPVLFPVFANGKTILTVNGGSFSIETEETEVPDFLNPVYPDQVDKNSGIVNISGTLSNPNTTPYLCFVAAVVLDDSMSGLISYSHPSPYDLDGAESIDIDFSTVLSSASRISNGFHYLGLAQLDYTTGRVYLLCEPERVYFTEISGIESIFGDETGHIEFYTIEGIKVAETKGDVKPDIPSGLYIVRTSKGSSKVFLK